MQIRAAHARGKDLHEDLLGPRFGIRDVHDIDFAGTCEADGAHQPREARRRDKPFHLADIGRVARQADECDSAWTGDWMLARSASALAGPTPRCARRLSSEAEIQAHFRGCRAPTDGAHPESVDAISSNASDPASPSPLRHGHFL